MILLTTAFIFSFTAGVVYHRIFRENLQEARQMVLGIAATGALNVDGDMHEKIPADPSALTDPAYQKLQDQLQKILKANPDLRYVWTMIPGDKPKQTIFVGDVGDAKANPGMRYDATQAPALLKGFQMPSVDLRPVQDNWGVSISGYAPIRNMTGKTVAVLGVDLYAPQLRQFEAKFRYFVAVSMAVGVLFAVLVGFMVSRWISHPLAHLVQGMRRVKAGNLHHEVFLDTQDEFQEAATVFNQMTTSLREARDELKLSFLKTIQSLMSALEAKDPYTRGHSESVRQYAEKIAKVLRKSAQEIQTLNRLTILHDIGKIGIHDEVLLKPGPLNEEERKSIEKHPLIGSKILAPLGFTPDELALIISHHEREDGTGYPHGLDRSKISDLVAIVSVADSYDAMTSHRPHRRARRPAEALEELRRGAGTQFRPEVVEAMAVVLQQQKIL